MVLTQDRRRAIAGELGLDEDGLAELEQIIAMYRGLISSEVAPLSEEERAARREQLEALEAQATAIHQALQDFQDFAGTTGDEETLKYLRRHSVFQTFAGARQLAAAVAVKARDAAQGYAPRGKGRPEKRRDPLRWFVARLGLFYQSAMGKKPTRGPKDSFSRVAQACLDAATPGARLPDRIAREVCKLMDMDKNPGEDAGKRFEEILAKEPVSVESASIWKK